MKNLQQLRYVQELYEEKILSEPEFIEQKQMILDLLRKLTESHTGDIISFLDYAAT